MVPRCRLGMLETSEHSLPILRPWKTAGCTAGTSVEVAEGVETGERVT